MPIFQLTNQIEFPPPWLAEKDGLLAIGGDLCEERLLLAYQMGIFPWFSENEPILWWSPDPRLVLYPKQFKISKSLKKLIKKEQFNITMDTAFEQVINACAKIRIDNNQGTWIVDQMIEAYCRLHEKGFAHSVEIWHLGKLAGGLYGVSIGKAFFGESMFTDVSNASKVALTALVKYLENISFDFIDCQVKTSHLISLGAINIPRIRFLEELYLSMQDYSHVGKWQFDFQLSELI